MRSETRIGVVVGLLVVVSASIFFWRAKREERDLIVALTPPSPSAGSTGNPLKIPPPAGDSRVAAAPSAQPKLAPPPATAAPQQPRLAQPLPTFGNSALRPINVALALQMGPPAPPAAQPLTLPPLAKADPKPAIALPRLSDSTAGPTPLKTAPAEPLREAVRPKTDASVPIAGSSMVAMGNRPAGPIEPVDRDREAFLAEYKQDPNRWVSSDGPKPADGRVSLPAGAKPNEGWVSSESAPASSDGWPKSHTVRRGETLASIARSYYGDVNRVRAILDANPKVRGPKKLYVGTVLTLPAPPGGTTVAAAPRDAITDEVVPAPRDTAAPRGYTVRAGDSFYSIAAEQLGDGRRWKELLTLNRKVVRNEPTNLRPGMQLRLPEASSGPAPAPVAATGRPASPADSGGGPEVVDVTDLP